MLSLAGDPLPLGPRVVDTLAALVERAGAVVTKDELLDRVWIGEDVGESNVAQSVYTLRKVLREHGLGTAIATVPRRGYRFVGAVELVSEPLPPSIPVRQPVVAQPLARGNDPRRWLTAAFLLALAFVATVPARRAVQNAPPALSAHEAELYRLGRYYWNLRTRSGLANSARLFAAVVAGDPRNARVRR